MRPTEYRCPCCTTFIHRIILLAGITSLMSLSPVLIAAQGNRPNIVIIYTDDQGFGDASCLNSNSRFPTPNLDLLAKEGLTFTNAHSPDTVCTPSRYGLLTGRYCWRTEKKTGVLGAEAPCLIKNGRMTIASLLRDVGYHTAIVGKWHLGMQFPGKPGSRDWSKPVIDMPLDKGFEYFYGVPASLNYGILAWFEGQYAKVPPILYTTKKKNNRHVDYRIMPPYQASAEATNQKLGQSGMEVAPDFIDNQCLTRFTDKAIQWIQSKTNLSDDDSPFFLYLPYTSPHYPVCPLPEFHGRGECGAYGEFMIETDYHVGRILQFLKRSGLEENTLVIFSSDNGPEKSWVQRIDEFGHDSSHIYRGGKRDIYEGGHRVPLFVRWPDGIKQPGRSWGGIVGQVDLLATIADIVKVTLPGNAGEDSQSFLRVLTDVHDGSRRAPLINHSARGRFSITDVDWKLLLPHGNSKLELYNLAIDPAEKHNVAVTQSQHVASLRRKATDIILNGRTTPGVIQANDSGYWRDLTWIEESNYVRRQKEAK